LKVGSLFLPEKILTEKKKQNKHHCKNKVSSFSSVLNLCDMLNKIKIYFIKKIIKKIFCKNITQYVEWIKGCYRTTQMRVLTLINTLYLFLN